MTTAASGAPIDRVLGLLSGVRATDRGWMARCPGHPDDSPSLSLRVGDAERVLINCFAGCEPGRVLDAIGLTFSDLRPGGGGAGDGRRATGVTLADLARAKGLPEVFLAKQGLRDARNPYDDLPEIEIPYYEADGKLYAIKRRTALRAAQGSRWPRRTPLRVYGLHHLARIREAGYVLLVEGETDVLTLVWHNLPALGVPGSKAVETLEAAQLDGVRRVYIGCEPDEGGETFREGVGRRLREIGYRYARRVLRWPVETKDPNALYLSDPPHFVERVRQMMREADREARANRHVRFPAPLLGPALVCEEIACMTALLHVAWDREDGTKEASPTIDTLATLAGFSTDTGRCGRALDGLIERGYVEVASGSEKTVFLIRPDAWTEGPEEAE